MGKLTKEEKKAVKAQKAAAKKAKKDAKMAKAKSVKWIPLIIVVALVAAIILSTDFILKTGIRLASQSAFGARCDIENVHLVFMNSSLEIHGFQQGDASDPMHNLFQFDSLICDIDINQLLSKHVAIDEMTVAGLALGTDRAESAYIEPKAKKEKKETVPDTAKNAGQTEPLIPKFDYTGILKTLTDRITAGVLSALPVADAQQLMQSLQNDLKTPVKTTEIKELSKTLVAYWQDKPAELTEQVTGFTEKVKNIQSISLNRESSIQDVQAAITQLTDLYNEGNQLQKNIQTTYKAVQSDSAKINSSISALTKAIDTDKKMISTSVSNITSEVSFSPAFFNEVANSVWNSVVGEAGPYIEKGKKILAIVSGKKSDSKPKKQPRKRLTGTTYTWGADYADVNIGKLHFSGMGYTGEVLNISSNQYITGKPTTALVKHEKTGGIQDSISLFLDSRGKQYSEDQFTADILWNTPVPLRVPGTFDATMSGASVNFSYDTDATVRFVCNGAFTDFSMYPPATGQATVDRILTASLTGIDTVSAALSYSSGSSVKSSTSLPATIKSRAADLLKQESGALAAEINEQAGQLLAQYLEEATGYSAEFTSITGAYEELTSTINTVQTEINAQIESYKKQLSDAAASAAKEATDAAKKAVQDAVNDAADKAGAALKGLFGR